MAINIKNIIIWFLSGLIIGAVIALFFKGCDGTDGRPEEVKTIRNDTIYITVPSKPIYLDTGKAKITYKYIKKIDTVTRYQDIDFGKADSIPAFTAELDTIVKNDTLSLKYYYPENYFWLSIKQQPDTLKTITIFKEKIIKVESNRQWWEIPLYVAGSFLIGYVIAK